MTAITDFIPNILNQDGSAIDPTGLSGKIVGLYFSAHWCPPCRGFTPKLASKYDELIKAGHNFEIVFISSDEDEESALKYFSSMPWKMLDFNNRDASDELSKRYDIEGIPTLVLLDEDGNVITTEGREAIMAVPFAKLKTFEAEKRAAAERAQRELEELQRSFSPATFFAGKAVDKAGNVFTAETLAGKMVGLYFSAHWCPPCRGFTPLLAEKYKEIIAAGHPFEIVFISSDRDEHSANEYFADMPWTMLTYSDRASKQALGQMYQVSGIPTLVVVDSSGATVTTNGRSLVMNQPFEKWTTFEADQKALQAKLEAEIASYPEEVVTPKHEHPLRKMPQVYRGSYGCDVCGGAGQGWVYHCDECGYDAHPLCAVIKDADSAKK